MKRIKFAIAFCVLPTFAITQPTDNTIDSIIDNHILPRFAALAKQTQTFAEVAAQDCDPRSEVLRSSYSDAFDAWIAAGHLRFGPTELDDRAFALAFWPDSRGATQRTLGSLFADQDPIVLSIDTFAEVSIAARGFYAMEFLLFDDTLMNAGDETYHCTLVQTMSADIASISQDILDDWQSAYAATLRTPSVDGVYRSNDEALQEVFKSLSTGLQFTSETRLGRPLGTFDRPRPLRAEARRSGRSSQHVAISLASLQDLAVSLARENVTLATSLENSFQRALTQLSDLNDPTFAGVSEPQTRIKVEIIQQSTETIRSVVRDELGPTLGVVAGFNSLDGD